MGNTHPRNLLLYPRYSTLWGSGPRLVGRVQSCTYAVGAARRKGQVYICKCKNVKELQIVPKIKPH